MSTSDSETEFVTSGEHFSTFERVHDRDDPHGVIVVIRTLLVRADAYTLSDGITVSDVYPAYPPSSPVVLCIYERVLDRAYPDWRVAGPSLVRTWALGSGGDGHADGVMAYPSAKLERYSAGNWTSIDDDVLCEHCNTRVGTRPDWVDHYVQNCPGGPS